MVDFPGREGKFIKIISAVAAAILSSLIGSIAFGITGMIQVPVGTGWGETEYSIFKSWFSLGLLYITPIMFLIGIPISFAIEFISLKIHIRVMDYKWSLSLITLVFYILIGLIIAGLMGFVGANLLILMPILSIFLSFWLIKNLFIWHQN